MAETAVQAPAAQPKIVLHWLDGSRAQSVLWLLVELDVPHEIKVYHRVNGMLAPAALREVWPLGKSPVLTIEPADASLPKVTLAESGQIMSYLAAHYARGPKAGLVPARWLAGQAEVVGGETAAWHRQQYLLHFAEGTMMPYLVFVLVLGQLRGPQVPWLVRPLTGAIANKINGAFTRPNIARNMALLESFLAAPPATGCDGDGYLCGGRLTVADILLSFPLLAARARLDDLGPWEAGSAAKTFPKTFAYIERIEKEPGYLRSIEEIVAIDGKFSVTTKPS